MPCSSLLLLLLLCRASPRAEIATLFRLPPTAMSRISAIAFVGLLVVALASCVAASAESHRNCLQKIDDYSNKGPLTYVMNTCSCSLKTQIITPGFNGTNTTVVSVPAWDGSTSTRNIGTCSRS